MDCTALLLPLLLVLLAVSSQADHSKAAEAKTRRSPGIRGRRTNPIFLAEREGGTSIRSARSRRDITTILPATYTFSSLTNAGQIVLSVPYIPASELTGNCRKYLSIQRENMHTGSKFNFSKTCPGTYDVTPFTVWTFDFKLAGLNQQQNYTFNFSFNIAKPAGQGTAFVVQLTKRTTLNKNDIVPFDNISLKSNAVSVNGTSVYVLESGLYVTAIRLDPVQSNQSLQLFVNDVPKPFIAYSTKELYHEDIYHEENIDQQALDTVVVSSVTGILTLYKGDRLNVRALIAGDVDKYTMFSAVYVSPIQGGYAFVGQEEQTSHLVPILGAKMNFRNILTSVGKIDDWDDFTSFRVPQTGIYWVAMRTRDGNGLPYDVPNMCVDGWCSIKILLTYRNSAYLYAYGYSTVPSEGSSAFYFEREYVFKIQQTPVSATLKGAIFSFVYLSFNRQPHTSKYLGVAFTAVSTDRADIRDSSTKIKFQLPIVNMGCMFNSGNRNDNTIHIPLAGLYLVALRPRPKEGNNIILDLHVNNRVAWKAVAENSVPMGQTTVLRLAAGDRLWVGVAHDSRSRLLKSSVMISVAFAHP